MDCLLDTGAIVAMVVPHDQHHEAAHTYSLTPGLRFLTTGAVIGEAFTLLRRRLGYGVAATTARNIAAGAVTRIYHLDDDLDRETWAIVDEFAGVPLSYVDATLIALGRRLRVSRVFAFDEDFARAGMRLVPGAS